MQLEPPVLSVRTSFVGGAQKEAVSQMKTIASRMSRFLQDESGTETVEWALICALLVIGTLVAISTIGKWMKVRWNSVESAPDGL